MSLARWVAALLRLAALLLAIGVLPKLVVDMLGIGPLIVTEMLFLSSTPPGLFVLAIAIVLFIADRVRNRRRS